MSIVKFIALTNANPNATVFIGPWETGYDYKKNNQVALDGDLYLAIVNHTSAGATEPGTGADWTDAWVKQLDSVSADQLAALAGTEGTPGSGNKYVTNADTRFFYPSTWYWADQSFTAKTVSDAADRYKFLTPNVIQLDIGGSSYTLSTQAEIDLSLEATWDTIEGTDYTVAANRAGKDFYVYAVQPESGAAPAFKVSANSTVPSGYDASDSRKLGGFHCLCLSAGTISGHPASGYLTGDIIPNSVWDLKFRSESGNNQGLAFDRDDSEWKFIYFASNDGGKAASVFGATIWDTITWFNAVDACAAAGVRLMRDFEFQNGAIGSNEQTNIAGSADPVTTGGHSDTAGRRMISHKFLEDCCGALWQWLDEQSYRFDAAASHTHSVTVSGDAQTVTSGGASADVAPAWGYKAQTGGKGSLYTQGTYGTTKLFAGGDWYGGTHCGSRARSAYYYPWNTHSAIGFRAVSRSVTK